MMNSLVLMNSFGLVLMNSLIKTAFSTNKFFSMNKQLEQFSTNEQLKKLH